MTDFSIEDAWERRNAFHILDDRALSAMLTPAFPRARVLSANLLTEGKINTNYRVMLSEIDEPVVVRVYARDNAACRKEIAIERIVRGHVAIPQVIYADVDGVINGHPYAVFRWAEGIKPHKFLASADLETTINIGNTIGRQLAAIGAYTFPESGFFGPDLTITERLDPLSETCGTYISEQLTGTAGSILGEKRAERLWNLIQQRLPLLATIDTAPSLTHGDYKSTNLLLQQNHDNWEVSAVLDWEFAFAATSLFDLGQVLRVEADLDSPFAQGVIHGYVDAGGSLHHEWRTIIRLLDLVNLCEFLSTSQSHDSRRSDATKLILHTMNEWERS